MTDEETVTLHTSDNKEVEVLRSIAEESVTVRQVLEDNPSVAVPLVNVRSQILTKVVEFCKFNVDAKHMKDDEGRAALVEVRLVRTQDSLLQTADRSPCCWSAEKEGLCARIRQLGYEDVV